MARRGRRRVELETWRKVHSWVAAEYDAKRLAQVWMPWRSAVQWDQVRAQCRSAVRWDQVRAQCRITCPLVCR